MNRFGFSTIKTLTSRRAFSATARTNDVAKLTLVGRLGSNPEKLTSANGRDYARYAVAVKQGRDLETSWYHVVSFENNIDYLVNNFAKGSIVYVEAAASLQPFETADGRRVGSLQLVQRNITKIAGPKAKEHSERSADGEEASESA
ncbi:hypothetical protein V1514DRAFT_327705 [Lipomyces japonicus]|uniref:uncharacterized protein n=1 Tax=Lipomyces japonicus TaxID=56871 RepID=UPI0034CF299E